MSEGWGESSSGGFGRHSVNVDGSVGRDRGVIFHCDTGPYDVALFNRSSTSNACQKGRNGDHCGLHFDLKIY